MCIFFTAADAAAAPFIGLIVCLYELQTIISAWMRAMEHQQVENDIEIKSLAAPD